VLRPKVALAVSAGSVALFALLYVGSAQTVAGQRLDAWVFKVLFSLVPPGLPGVAVGRFARQFVLVGLAVAVTLLSAAAWGRRAWGALTASVLTVSVSVVLSPALRDGMLTRPTLVPGELPGNGLPSTHASASAALTSAVLLLWPGRRPWWLGNAAGVVLLLVALGNILSQAHRPSDVMGSFLLVTAVGGVAYAVGRPDLDRPVRVTPC
jgi:membrane-associated phospholipid phosphatase